MLYSVECLLRRAGICTQYFWSSFKFHLGRFRRLLLNYICLQSPQSGLDISTYLYFHHLKTFHLNEILAHRPLYFCVIIFLAQKTRRFRNRGGQFNCPLPSLRGADHQSRTRRRRMSCLFARNLPGIFFYLSIILFYFTRDIYCLPTQSYGKVWDTIRIDPWSLFFAVINLLGNWTHKLISTVFFISSF